MATHRRTDWNEQVDTQTGEDPYAQLRAKAFENDNAVLLFDARHIANRAFHTRELSDSSGRDTSVLHGLLGMIQGACEAANTRRWLLVWDGGVEYKRKLHPAYKCRHDRKRTPEEQDKHERLHKSIKVAMKALSDIGAPQVLVDDLEADDVIGMLAPMVSRAGLHAVIVSDDKDYYQLIGPRILVWRGIVGQLVTRKRFRSQHGFDPEQYVDFKALVGESATGDNIPKVAGIGEVWATKFVSQHGDIESMIRYCKGRMKDGKVIAKEAGIATGGDTIRLAYKLSRIARTTDDLKVYEFTKTRRVAIGNTLREAGVDAVMKSRSSNSTSVLSVWTRHDIASIDHRAWARTCGLSFGK